MEPTLKPASNFNAENDANVLRKAMKGLGTDEKAIIDVLAHRSCSQRQEIKALYKTMFGKDLVKDLKSELGGKFEDVIVGLMMTEAEYDASELKRAMKGLGTDEDAMIEILCSRTNQQIKDIKDAYKRLFKATLEKDIESDTSGHFKRLMVSLASGGRMENQPVDMTKAQEDAQRLYAAGEKKLGTDESTFNSLLASQSYEQLRAVFDAYQKISGKDIEQVIKSEMSGNLEIGMVAIVRVVRNRPGYFAKKLYHSMKGLGTDDKTLIRVIITRAEVDMVQVKQEFQKEFGKSLEDFIKDDTSGDYRKDRERKMSQSSLYSRRRKMALKSCLWFLVAVAVVVNTTSACNYLTMMPCLGMMKDNPGNLAEECRVASQVIECLQGLSSECSEKPEYGQMMSNLNTLMKFQCKN
uniref:Annexin n=1 Tax=Magallana gigas TaxID=29159 RepID=A0A8W8MLT7_MAGGI